LADKQNLLRHLPAVDRLLNEPAIAEALETQPRRLVLQAIQETLNDLRLQITGSDPDRELPDLVDISPGRLAEKVVRTVAHKAALNIGPLINATGIVIHTNLGRAPLSAAAIEALTAVAGSYNNLEFDLTSGRRGSRQDHLEEIICDLTGAESALVLNNNAAAVFLALNTVASGRSVVVSRGQLVEIGGSFRIPEIMSLSGARLSEVGTTNKTYLRDYEMAVGEDSAAFLKVHTSNYHMVGFTAEADRAELADLAHRYNLVMIEDLGSGVLLDLEKYGLPAEPRVQDSIAAGVDLVTFSGDKMLGGPQAGIVVGRADLVKKMRTNQLARSLRVDKFTVAALEATLRLYYDEELVISEIPVWRMLTFSSSYLLDRAESIASRFACIFGSDNVSVIHGISKVGGGALPAAELKTSLVSVRLKPGHGSPDTYAEELRYGNPPVILRLQQDSLLFDPRTVFEHEEDHLVASVEKAYKKLSGLKQ
jgi:L-seryl-tRNA(Ser) seleniumtransferase